MSFGKRDRKERPPISNSVFQEFSGFRAEMMDGGDGISPLEFSDESLFGEDKIEDLIDRKVLGGSNGQNNIIVGDSFRSKTGNAMMRTSEDIFNQSNQGEQ
jgi:hypothetical protein